MNEIQFQKIIVTRREKAVIFILHSESDSSIYHSPPGLCLNHALEPPKTANVGAILKQC